MSEGGNPFAQLAAAARGDLEAQRTLAHAAMLRFFNQDGTPRDPATIDLADGAALIEGLVFARMAAAHGEDEDQHRLIGMLSLGVLLPDECAIPVLAEKIARASMWAEHATLTDNETEAADLLTNQFTEQAPPEAVACSQLYRRLILESETA